MRLRGVSVLLEDIAGAYSAKCADSSKSRHVAVEVKRKATIEAVEQLTRYLELLNRDPLLAPVRGILAAQSFTAQTKTLAADRDIQCVTVDYDELRGLDSKEERLF